MTHFDDDLAMGLATLVDQIPLPPTTPDDDLRRGRKRLRRNRVLSASGLAAAAALVIGASLLVTGTLRADGPVPPVDTPTPTPTTSTTTVAEPGPAKVAQIFDVGDGFIAREESGQLWHRGPEGWEKRGVVHDLALHFAENGRDGYGYEFATHDGGRTWTRYRSIGSACWPVEPAMTSRAVYLLPFSACDNTWQGRAAVQDFGGGEKQEVAMPPYLEPGQEPPTFVSDGDLLVGRIGASGEATLAHVMVSRDDGRTWDELPAPCQATSPVTNAELGTDPDRTQVLALCQADNLWTVFRLVDGTRWEKMFDSPLPVSDATWGAAVGPEAWIFGNAATAMFATTEGSVPRSADVAFPRGFGAGWGSVAAIDNDLYVKAVRLGEWVGPIYVSRDGGRTWEREERP